MTITWDNGTKGLYAGKLTHGPFTPPPQGFLKGHTKDLNNPGSEAGWESDGRVFEGRMTSRLPRTPTPTCCSTTGRSHSTTCSDVRDVQRGGPPVVSRTGEKPVSRHVRFRPEASPRLVGLHLGFDRRLLGGFDESARLVFDAFDAAGEGLGLRKINADGSGLLQLTDPSRGYDSDPAWQPRS
jgi:hypothetical protein